MKTILTHFGKSVIMVLYWALVALFVWAFYDEYITEQSWASICMCIAVFSFGCAFHGVIINWLYNVELKRIEQCSKKIYNILVNVGSKVSWIFGGISVVFFLIGIFGAFIYYGILEVFLIISHTRTWVFVLLIIFTYMIYVILGFFEFAIFKSLTKIIYRVFLISLMALVVYNEIELLRISADADVSYDIAGGLFLLLFGFLCYFLYNSMKKGILSFAKFRYVLFLRSFKNDDDVQAVYNKISKSISDVPIIKIGNPDKSESKNIDEHWLPLNNWKFFLKFYISKAKAIVIIVSSTDGLIWEMVQNLKYLNKCIIFFASPNELAEFKNKLLLLGNVDCNIMIYSIELVMKKWKDENAFVISHNKIYMGEVCSLIDSVLKNDYKDVNFIKANSIVSTKTNLKRNCSISDIGNFLFRHFHVLNLVNIFESIHNNTFRTIIISLATLFTVVMYICQFLFGILMLLSPLFIWCCGDFACEPNLVKVIMSLFCPAWGLAMIKDLFKELKKE